MAFHNTRLPEQIERGSQGGPGFKTTVLILSSGFEKRNIEWERTRGMWDISYGVDNKEDQNAIRDFFFARQGRAHGFRFKDWNDFEIGDADLVEDQEVGIGDGSTDLFQIVKTYTSGSETYSRPITRIVSGTITVYIDDVEQVSGFTVDGDTGIIDFVVAPAAAEVVGVICEFDVPVRFDDDNLAIRAFTADAFSLPAINLIELREELTVIA